MKTLDKSCVWGAIGGFIVAGLIALASLTGIEGNVYLEGVRNFLSALPLFVVMKLWPGAPEVLLALTLFVYWIGLGALIAWGAGKGRTGKIAVTVGILVLAFAHFEAKLNIEHQLEGAGKAFELFIREIDRSLRGGGAGK